MSRESILNGLHPRIRGVELTLVALAALVILLPGIWSYTLIDPWETHYGEVGRRMLQDHDWVRTTWQDEGFRSKPVLSFWLMATSMKANGVAVDGGYSGEMISSGHVMFALRLPFVLCGVAGLCAAWWMLARMVSRRAAWLAFLVLGTTPIYALMARQAIPDITLTATLIAAMAMFAVAGEAGDEPVAPIIRASRRWPIALDHRHLLLLIAGGFIVLQIVGFAMNLAERGRLGIPIDGRVAGILIGAPLVLGLVMLALCELRGPQFRWIRTVAYCVLALPSLWFLGLLGIRSIWTHRADAITDVKPTTTMRQVYLYWFWFFLGVSVLAKGPPALAIAGVSCAFYVILLGRWRDFFEDRFELVRGFAILLMVAIPWHVAMYFADGRNFPHEYIYTHLLGRASHGDGADKGAKGTFAQYAVQVGYGMFVWAALLPGALAALALRLRTDTPEGRARLLVAIWGMVAVTFFSMIAAKFHHYVLPIIPPLAIAIAFWLDEVLGGRTRGVSVVALVGAAIVLLVANDMMSEQKVWIEMFVYRYDRPWPTAAPWQVDASDGFLGLGVAAALALGVMALPRLARVGVALFGGVAIAAVMWSMHWYMPIAAQHWGMRSGIAHYYNQREIHGAHLVYDGARQLAGDWAARDADGVRDTWTIRTHVPETLQEGQPVVIRITLKTPDDKRIDRELSVRAKVTGIHPDDARVVVTLPEAEQAKLAALVKQGKQPGAKRPAKRAIRAVDADKLIAWQLYWRGENFWSANEIWGPLPELQTAFKQTDNVKFLAYLNDRTLCPEGRRYWIVTEAGRANTLKTLLPTARAKATYQVEDTSSNKFTVISFVL